MPAVRTSVIPTDNALSGGCNAAEAINHAADAINKISLSAAVRFAMIAGKNLLNFIVTTFLFERGHMLRNFEYYGATTVLTLLKRVIEHDLSEFACAEL